MPSTGRLPSYWHRTQWNLGFIAAILLTLGLDIALAYLIYRAVLMFW